MIINDAATSFLKSLSTSMIGATVIALGTVASPSHAAILVDPSPTFGSSMAGMEVIANFLDGRSETVTWEATDVESGGAFGTDWSLTISGSTFYSSSANPEGSWTFTNLGNSISSLVINAIPGKTVFDVIDTVVEPPSTPGSARGLPFTVLSGIAPDSFTYSDELEISQGDLFGTLALSYTNGFTGAMTYVIDSDTIAYVPESSSILGLLAFGAWSASSMFKRRQQRAK